MTLIVILFMMLVAAIAGIAIYFVSRTTQQLISEQSYERVRWVEEREQLMAERRYLNDRYLARHAAEAAALDRSQMPAEPRQDREPLARYVPEGL